MKGKVMKKKHMTRQDKARKNARKRRKEYLDGHGKSKYALKNRGNKTAMKARENGIENPRSPLHVVKK